MSDRREEYHAALASSSRRQVLDTLRGSPEPLDAAAVAEHLGLHITTARFHLDQLTTAGLAHRRAGAEKRRGRPRLLYAPAGSVRDEDAREQLIHVLAGALAREDDPDADASRAGRRWAAAFAPLDPVDPVPDLIEVFDRLGFEPERDSDSDTDSLDIDAESIRLQSCPFRDSARDHPEVVCTVHRGLIEKLLDGTSTRAQLIPFVAAELCVVTLARSNSPELVLEAGP
ncbi:MAG: helix-turn-helix domain-containing protein [Rhodoglobus sp.]|nr:helix-turn-helix domain-containing protein [Rhodoglobus sp.]